MNPNNILCDYEYPYVTARLIYYKIPNDRLYLSTMNSYKKSNVIPEESKVLYFFDSIKCIYSIGKCTCFEQYLHFQQCF